MFARHSHNKAGVALAAHHDHHQAHVAALKLAAEVALLLGLLAAWGLVISQSGRAPGAGDHCVFFGRAGERCDPPSLKPEEACQSLGRAGRFCPPAQ